MAEDNRKTDLVSSCWCQCLCTQNTTVGVVGALLMKHSGLAGASKPAQFSRRILAQALRSYWTTNGSVRLILLAPYFM